MSKLAVFGVSGELLEEDVVLFLYNAFVREITPQGGELLVLKTGAGERRIWYYVKKLLEELVWHRINLKNNWKKFCLFDSQSYTLCY